MRPRDDSESGDLDHTDAESDVPDPTEDGVGADTVRLEPYTGPWADDDPDANFKADVALYASVDPMVTIRTLSGNVGVPIGALVWYVLAKYATGGSGGLLELGPTMVHRLWEPIERAERAGTTEARLGAYEQLRQMIGWLRLPLADPSVYPEQG
jgi:hypothetical protein